MSDQFNNPPSQSENIKYTPEQQKRIKEIDDFVDSMYESDDSFLKTSFSTYWMLELNRNYQNLEILNFLTKKLENKIFIDLGFGDGSSFTEEHMLGYINICKDLKVKKYVGVEKNFSNSNDEGKTFELFKNQCKKTFNEKGIEADFERQDMLKYIVRLPDESANFIINGIDKYIIPNAKYQDYLAKEIYKKLNQKELLLELTL